MLSTLLPGIRELRAPLVAGFLWLLAICLLLQESIPSRADASGAYKLGYALDTALGGASAGAALGVLAYLLGTLSLALLVGGFPGGRFWRPHVRFVPRAGVLPLAMRRTGCASFRAPFGSRGQRVLLVVARETVERMQPVIAALAAVEEAGCGAGQHRDCDTFSYPTVSHPNIHHAALKHVARTASSHRDRNTNWGTGDEIDRLLDCAAELSSVVRRADHEYRALGPKPEFMPVRRPSRRSNSAASTFWSIEHAARSMLEEAVADLVVADFEMMRTRLLREDTRELSSAIDRLRTEADLRFAVAAPITALFIILAAQTESVASLLGLGAVVVLIGAAVQRRKDAGDMLLDALNERTRSPALERLNSDIARIVTGTREASSDPFAAPDEETPSTAASPAPGRDDGLGK